MKIRVTYPVENTKKVFHYKHIFLGMNNIFVWLNAFFHPWKLTPTTFLYTAKSSRQIPDKLVDQCFPGNVEGLFGSLPQKDNFHMMKVLIFSVCKNMNFLCHFWWSMVLLDTSQLVEKAAEGLEDIPNFPFPCLVCVCVFLAYWLTEMQGNSIGSASSVTNAGSAQWGIHWEQWCWQWMVIMDFSDKLTCCRWSDLTTGRAVRQLWCEECFESRSVRTGHSEGRTSLNDVSGVVGRKEGRTDSRLYLSLINLSDGVEKCLHLINKRDTAYAFPHKLVKWPDVRRVTDTVALMEDVRWNLDPRSVLQSESQRSGL